MPPLVPVRPHVRSWPHSGRPREPGFDFAAALAEAWDRDEDRRRLRSAIVDAEDRGGHREARRLRRDLAQRELRDACRAMPPAEVAGRVDAALASADADDAVLDALAASLTLDVPIGEEARDGAWAGGAVLA